MRKLNARKAAGPDGLPGRLIKEFACELSIPVTDIFNSSLREGVVPQVWKDATIAPIPKESPATISKLRPISLTSLLAKVCEGFVSKWVLHDISSSIDRNQYGSIKGSSTSHCLIEILDILFRGTDKRNAVGTLVVTDFSKAFDCVTILWLSRDSMSLVSEVRSFPGSPISSLHVANVCSTILPSQSGKRSHVVSPRVLNLAQSHSLVLLIMLLRSLWHIALSMSMIWRLLKLAQLTNPAKSTRMCRTWMLGLMTTTSCSTQGSVRSCKFASNGTRRAPQASKLQVLILRRCLKPSFLVLLSSLILAGSPKLITWWLKVVVGCIC